VQALQSECIRVMLAATSQMLACGWVAVCGALLGQLCHQGEETT
jgi:hypothetical protein